MTSLSNISQLKPDKRNARKHNDRNIGMIADSLREVGAARSIVIDEDGNILAGNGTVQAAKDAGLTKVQVVEADGDTLVAVRRSGLTTEQKTRLALADNRTAELAEWNEDVLKELVGEGFDFEGLFDDSELEALLAGVTEDVEDGLLPEADPDAVPENVETRCKRGDLWLLGKHRLLCGDSTVATDVERVLNSQRPALCLTDPPYGVGFQYDTHNDTESNLVELIEDFLPLARLLCDVVYITPGNGNQWLYPRSDWCMGWFVPAGAGCGTHGFTCWQPVLVYGKDPFLARGKGLRPDALCKTESAPDVDHSCPKPVEVWKWFMERGSVESGDIVYDPFLGSGTTLIAAEQLGRICYGIEISDKYCDVILQRWENATGKKAVLSDAKTGD